VRDLSCGDRRVFLEIEVRRVECVRCGKVIQEKLPFLANNPFYTKRFAFYVGRRCRSATIKDVAEELLQMVRENCTEMVTENRTTPGGRSEPRG
jgi:transposase